MKPFYRPILMLLVVIAGGFILSCCNLDRAASPTPTMAGLVKPIDSTPSPTTAMIPGEPDQPPAATTPPPPTSGEIELHFTDAMTQKDCEAHFPFNIITEDGQRKIDGTALLDCQCEIEQCGDGVCLLYHSKHYLDATLVGIIHGPTTDFPAGFLEASVAGTYTLTQYWSNVPPETFVLYTEDNPSVFTGSDIIPINFNFKEGAIEEISTPSGEYPWILTLHLY